MAKFCKKCGSLLDEASGKCPNCDKVIDVKKKKLKKQAKIDKKKQKRAQLTTKQKIKKFFVKIFVIILALIIVICSCIFALVYFDKIDIPIIKNIFDKVGISEQKNDYDNLAHDIDELKGIDVGEELRNESQVLESIDVATSDQVTSEADIAKQFKDKGFVNCVIYTAYSMDGTYNDDEKIDEESSDCHPLYYATYISDDNYCWTVYSCNGEWSASPISYLYSGLAASEIIVSEREYIMSYDSYANCFYKIIPSSNECVIRSVSVINSKALDELAEKEFSTS